MATGFVVQRSKELLPAIAPVAFGWVAGFSVVGVRF